MDSSINDISRSLSASFSSTFLPIIRTKINRPLSERKFQKEFFSFFFFQGNRDISRRINVEKKEKKRNCKFDGNSDERERESVRRQQPYPPSNTVNRLAM